MESYSEIVPGGDKVLTVELPKKSGRIPKGSYGFVEYYCAEPGDDCRRMTVGVFNEKMKQKAMIGFGFDQQGPFAGPYLDTASTQAPYASDILDLFVDRLNSDPQWLERFYRHYREVREKVERKPYAGKPFPKPGTVVYHAMEPPDLSAEIEQSIRNLQAGGWSPAPSGRRSKPIPKEERGKREPESLALLVKRYVEAGLSGQDADLIELRGGVRAYLLSHERAGEELATLLPALYRQSPQPDEQIQGALRLFFDMLVILDQEQKNGHPEAGRSMETLQKAVAQHLFSENEDPDLCAAAANILIQSRVEILPVLRGSATGMMITCGPRSDLHDLPAEDVLTGISRSLHSLGVDSPFQAADELLQLFTLSEVEMQKALIAEMLESGEGLLRESAALMLFHPDAAVRVGVSRALAGVVGEKVSPDALRRLIVSRNWFPEEIRKNVDQAVTNARRGRVQCAPLPKLPAVTVYASPIDALGRQHLEAMVAQGSGYARCSISLRQGEGVVAASVASLKSRYELDGVTKGLKGEGGFLESSAEHLDLRLCNGLSDGVQGGRVPNHWLVRVAELLGRDRWRPISLDPVRELLSMQEELAAQNPRLLDEREYRDAVQRSAEIYRSASFFSSWMEAGEEVAKDLEGVPGKGKSIDAGAAVERLLETTLERDRGVWLERLVVTALWLKSSPKPPLPWHRVFQIAQAIADESLALKEIPIMGAIAENSLKSYLAGKK